MGCRLRKRCNETQLRFGTERNIDWNGPLLEEGENNIISDQCKISDCPYLESDD